MRLRTFWRKGGKFTYKVEIWRDIPGYNGRYQVSNCGNVRTNDYNHTGITKLLSMHDNGRGYLIVSLTKNNKGKKFKVHRLVAECFIDNPDNLPVVNHKDENKQNNHVNNLEWCTNDYNTHYGTAIKRRGKPVKQMLNGLIINQFDSASDAQRKTGINRKHIVECCKQKPHCHTAGGYKWQYAS
ncbi:MAG: HNH endonuclease [Clostridia bacterium]|nr:HNH endonuclease [Clostridia bacterium]